MPAMAAIIMVVGANMIIGVDIQPKREAWGRNELGEYPADNLLIRGTRYNMGAVLRDLQSQGADMIGDFLHYLSAGNA